MKLTYDQVSDEIYKMFKLSALSLFIATLTCHVFAISLKSSGPVIRKEIKEQNGRKVEYMYIDGIKVHETDPEKQPQPPVVNPKPYDAKAAKPPKGAVVLFDGTPKTLKNWQATKGGPTKWKLVDGAWNQSGGVVTCRARKSLDPVNYILNLPHPVKQRGVGRGVETAGSFLWGSMKSRFWIPTKISLIRTGSAEPCTDGPSLW